MLGWKRIRPNLLLPPSNFNSTTSKVVGIGIYRDTEFIFLSSIAEEVISTPTIECQITIPDSDFSYMPEEVLDLVLLHTDKKEPQ